MSATALSALLEDLQTSGVISDPLRQVIGDIVSHKLQRLKMWTKPPESLGYQYSSWEERCAIGDIADDAIDESVKPWLLMLAKYKMAGAVVAAQVANLVELFLTATAGTGRPDWRDVSNSAISVIKAGITDGWLQVVGGPRTVGHATLVAGMSDSVDELTVDMVHVRLVSDPSFAEYLRTFDTRDAAEKMDFDRAVASLADAFKRLVTSTRGSIRVKTLVRTIVLARRADRCTTPCVAEQNTVEGITVGSVLRVPDKLWGFFDPERTRHPGACWDINNKTLRVSMLKGTDARNIPDGHWWRYHEIRPSGTNGLKKPTAFDLEPFQFKLRRLCANAPPHTNTLGFLDENELSSIKQARLRGFPKKK